LNPKEINLDNQVESELEKVKQTISETTSSKAPKRLQMGDTFYTAIVKEFSEGTRNTPEQIDYIEAFEKAVTIFKTASVALRTEMDILTLEQRLGALKQGIEQRENITQAQKKTYENAEKEKDELQQQIIDAIFFSNRYALYFAGQVGLALLNAEKADIKNIPSFGTKYDASKESSKLVSLLAEMVTKDIERIASDKKSKGEKVADDDLRYTLECVFTSWINQFNWSTFKDVTEKHNVENMKLRFKNYSLQAGDFKRKHDQVLVDDKLMPIKKENVIGEQKFGKTIWSNLVKLSAYNHEKMANPYDPASVIFIYGEPGGGKTFTSHAYIQSFSELCREKGISLWALTHSTTDYASHYQNLTANRLAELAGKIKDFPGIVIMYVADADNIFQSRKNPDLTAEQQQTLGVYFKMFDGTMIPKNGKFMAIMDANYIEGIDDATKSRLFDEVLELERFDKPEQFADLARAYLTKGAESKIPEKDWQEIGKYLLQSPLSNREINHVVKQLRRDFTVPEDMIGKPYEEHVAFRNKHIQGINKDTIISTFDNYITTRMEIERKSHEAKMKEDTQRFLDYLATQGAGEAKTK